MSDREEFTEARAAGLKARHETRLARVLKCGDIACPSLADCKDPDCALAKKHLPADPLAAHGWRDDVDEMHAHETREARAIRKQVAEEIALALEGFSENDIRGRADMSIDRAAQIAREIGSKEGG